MFKHYDKLKTLLALELNCAASDFERHDNENIVTLPALNDGRRQYQSEPYFFHIASLGGNAVITADAALHGFLSEWCSGKPGYSLFEQPKLLPLENELAKHGYTLTESYHMFLPKTSAISVKADFETKWYYGKEIHKFYGDPRFPNAICGEYLPHRPDTIAVCAVENGEITGMAGCSEDANGFQQIGIDVMSQHRSKGIGTGLVALLKKEIEQRGDIPFYGTSLSNLHSWNIALNCGFRPAWVEIGCKRLNRS